MSETPFLKKLQFVTFGAMVGAAIGLAATSLVEFMTPDPDVPEYEYNCVTSDFQIYFKAGGKETSAKPLATASVRVKLTSLDSAIQEAKKVSASEHGLKVHHGLVRTPTGDFNYSPALQFVKLSNEHDDEWDEQPIALAFMTVSPSGALIAQDESLWTADALYRDSMWVRPNETNGQFYATANNVDVDTYTFPVSRVEKLLTHNEDDAAYVQVSSIAEPREHVSGKMWGMRHHLSLVTLNASGGLILDDHGHLFSKYKAKALDVGSPCPPRCPKVYLPKHGVDVRASCPKP